MPWHNDVPPADGVDLLAESPLAAKVDQLFLLTKESFKRRQIDELWQTKRATSRTSIASIAQSAPVIDAIRKQLWRRTRLSADTTEVTRLVRSVLRADLNGSA